MSFYEEAPAGNYGTQTNIQSETMNTTPMIPCRRSKRGNWPLLAIQSSLYYVIFSARLGDLGLGQITYYTNIINHRTTL